jgi:hypothetical protein
MSSQSERAKPQPPDQIDLSSARDLGGGRAGEIWVRRGLAGLVAVLPIVGLFNVFGQRAVDSQTAATAATLTVHAPHAVRGGLLFEARFTVTAKQHIKDAVLELSPEWANGMTINTVEPQPSNESSDKGWLSLDLGELKGGDRFQLHLQYQVNPTTTGGKDLGVRLMDGQTLLATLQRQLQVWP